MNLEEFFFMIRPSQRPKMICPDCEWWNTELSVTNRSVKFHCNRCKKDLFYRRIDNV